MTRRTSSGTLCMGPCISPGATLHVLGTPLDVQTPLPRTPRAKFLHGAPAPMGLLLHWHPAPGSSPSVLRELAAATLPLLQIFSSPRRIPWARPTHSIATSTASLGAAGHGPQLFPQPCHAHTRLTSPYPSGRLLLLVLVLPSWGNSSRKTGESRSSLPTSANCRGLWLVTWGCSGLLGSRKLSTWPNKPPVLCNQRGGRQGRPGAFWRLWGHSHGRKHVWGPVGQQGEKWICPRCGGAQLSRLSLAGGVDGALQTWGPTFTTSLPGM